MKGGMEMFFGFGTNRALWFIVLVISLFILLFPDIFEDTTCT